MRAFTAWQAATRILEGWPRGSYLAFPRSFVPDGTHPIFLCVVAPVAALLQTYICRWLQALLAVYIHNFSLLCGRQPETAVVKRGGGRYWNWRVGLHCLHEDSDQAHPSYQIHKKTVHLHTFAELWEICGCPRCGQ